MSYFGTKIRKDSEKRMQRQIENEVFIVDYTETYPSLSKDSEVNVRKQKSLAAKEVRNKGIY